MYDTMNITNSHGNIVEIVIPSKVIKAKYLNTPTQDGGRRMCVCVGGGYSG